MGSDVRKITMAVYTTITDAELDAALPGYGLERCGTPRGVADGIENTTYFFDARMPSGEILPLVLTVLEQCPEPQRVFTTALTSHLAASGLPVPCPLRNKQGDANCTIAGKSALIFPRLGGKHLAQPGAGECRIIGDYLARAHLAARTFTPRLDNSRGLQWLAAAQDSLTPFLDHDDRTLLAQQVERYRKLSSVPGLPTGAIHGDLFRDNALFHRGTLAGVIDFFNACTDWLLLDVAITINDWCSNGSQASVDRELAGALLDAYHRARPFTNGERQCWQDMLCLAATRFWVSRLMGIYAPQLSGGEMKTKDPGEYRSVLKQRMMVFPPLPGSA